MESDNKGITFLIFAATLTWLVFAIIALAEDGAEKTSCGLLWDYVLTVTIFQGLSLLKHLVWGPSEGEISKPLNMVLIFLSTIGFTLWGTYEIWGRDCDHPANMLYDVAVAVVIYQWVLLGLLSLAVCMLVVMLVLTDDNELTENDVSNDDAV